MLPVGTLKPNEFGLFDVLGNAFEWCQDIVRYYPTNRVFAEDGEQAGVVREFESRALRGGPFNGGALNARAAPRYTYVPGSRTFYTGFRPARTYP